MKPYLKVKSDTTPLSTVIRLSGIQDAKGNYISDVTVTLTATDNQSGIKRTLYKLGNGQWQVYSSPFVIKETTIISYKSEDIAGNIEAEKTQEIIIEDINPWDLNSDGIVNILDLVIVAKNIAKPKPDNAKADVNKDGVVDMADLDIARQHFGEIYK